MNVSRRAMILGVGAALASGASAACSVRSVQSLLGLTDEGKPLEQRRPVLLEFWGGPDAQQRQDQVNAWHARYPHLKINFRTDGAVGAGVDALRAFAAHLAAKTAPHILDIDRFQVAAYANWRMFHPVEDYVRRDKYDLSVFAPAVLGEATGLDKRLYGLPSSVDNRLLYWNKQHFAEAGLNPEAPPATWEALQAAAVRLTRRAPRGGLQRLGFHAGAAQSTLHIFAWQNGGGFQSPDGKSATLPLPPNVEALAWMAGLLGAQAPWPDIQAFASGWGARDRDPFLTGQVSLHYEINSWAGDTIARYRPDLAFGVAPPPIKQAGSPPLTWSGGYSYVMSRNVKNADVAWELLKWLVSEEAWTIASDGEIARARAQGGVYAPCMTGQPALDAKLHSRYATGLPAVDRVAKVALDLMQHTRFREPCIAAADLWQGIAGAQQDALSRIRSPEDALAYHNTIVQRALDQAWVFAPR